MSMMEKLKNWDAFPKFAQDMQIKTFSGAAVSVGAILLIILLSLSELSIFLKKEMVDHLVIDEVANDKMRIDFDVTFPRIPCSLLSVDGMDVSGEQQLDLKHHITKRKLSPSGNAVGQEEQHDMKSSVKTEESSNEVTKDEKYCGSCYGAESYEGQCCNTCDIIRDLYRAKGWALDVLRDIEQCQKEGQTNEAFREELEKGFGCRIYGYVDVQKVSGNIHFAPGKSFPRAPIHIHDLVGIAAEEFNVSHTINKLSFGESYPGAVFPLDAVEHTVGTGGGMYMYYTKVVPTTYEYSRDEKNWLSTNQYSVTQHYRAPMDDEGKKTQGLTGVFIFYEFSPIRVVIQEKRKPILFLISQLCAILGGVLTVAGLIDRVVFRSLKSIEKKMELGKFN